MEIRLEGRIKTKVKDFGFIHCDSVNFDYYFHNSSFDEESNFEIGDLVSFSLRQNRGREGNHAYDLKKITLTGKIPTEIKLRPKLKFYFDSRDDLIFGFKCIKEKLEFQKSKCHLNYDEPEFIIEELDSLLNIINDFFDGPNPNINDVSFEEINYSTDKGFNITRFGQH